MSSQLLLVTSHDCHLCDRARALLARAGIEAREVDAGSAEARQLAERGIPLMFLPVLTDGARVIARSRFSARRLRKEVAG